MSQLNQIPQGSILAGNTATRVTSTYDNTKEQAHTGIERFSTSVDSYTKGAHISAEIRVSKVPQSIEDLAHIIASDYLKSKGIDMTLDEVIEEFLPEHTV